jgi:hypothetical protein
MGMDALSIKFIRLAHERGLGCGDVRELAIAGDPELMEKRWNFVGPYKRMTFASRMQHLIYWGPLKGPLEWTLKTVLAPWSYMASVVYHDWYWYPRHLDRVRQMLAGPWGRLFANWERVALPRDDLTSPGFADVGEAPARLERTALSHLKQAVRVLGTAIRESPEFNRPKTTRR